MRLKNMIDIVTYIYVTDLEQINYRLWFQVFFKNLENMQIVDHELVFYHERIAVGIW